ncbi:hypothetical protein X797_006754 [Metarhizium robertsii]|uniref:Uncharacterized protein n=1 Tax=Metarhizium robertsii TaxID=568076 RepID=A0A0A1UTK1_9HYPO|nr:hypothetical protein X797_006754 [Metarhizium robertsii]
MPAHFGVFNISESTGYFEGPNLENVDDDGVLALLARDAARLGPDTKETLETTEMQPVVSGETAEESAGIQKNFLWPRLGRLPELMPKSLLWILRPTSQVCQSLRNLRWPRLWGKKPPATIESPMVLDDPKEVSDLNSTKEPVTVEACRVLFRSQIFPYVHSKRVVGSRRIIAGGKYIILCKGESVIICDIVTLEEVRTLGWEDDQGLEILAFENHVVCLYPDEDEIVIWAAPDWKRHIFTHKGWDGGYDCTSKRLVTYEVDAIRIWDPTNLSYTTWPKARIFFSRQSPDDSFFTFKHQDGQVTNQHFDGKAASPELVRLAEKYSGANSLWLAYKLQNGLTTRLFYGAGGFVALNERENKTMTIKYSYGPMTETDQVILMAHGFVVLTDSRIIVYSKTQLMRQKERCCKSVQAYCFTSGNFCFIFYYDSSAEKLQSGELIWVETEQMYASERSI